MTHIEGVLKNVELRDNGMIYLEFSTYDSLGKYTEKLSIDAQKFLEKILLNEKIGLVVDGEKDDVINIRGVGKDFVVMARY